MLYIDVTSDDHTLQVLRLNGKGNFYCPQLLETRCHTLSTCNFEEREDAIVGRYKQYFLRANSRTENFPVWASKQALKSSAGPFQQQMKFNAVKRS